MIGRRVPAPAPEPRLWPTSELLLAGVLGIITTLALARLATTAVSRPATYERGAIWQNDHPAAAGVLGLIWELFD